MKILLTAVLLFCGFSLNAQAPVAQWLKKMGSTAIDQPNSMVLDAVGNIYIAGTFSGTVDFDPSAATAALASVGATNMFFAKYDPNGNYIWAKCITGGSGLINIAVDASQNVYIAGGINTGATYDFDPSSAVANLSSSGSWDMFVAKYTATGAYSWVKKIASNNLEYARAIDLDASGNIYTTGIFRSTVDFDPGTPVFNLVGNNTGSATDIFISKLNNNGDFLWAKSIGSTNFDDAFGIKVTAANVYVTGQFGETVDFDPGAGVYNLTTAQSGVGDKDAYLLKLDLAGNFVWARNIVTGFNDAKGETIAVDASGNVYTAGWFSGSNADFDPGIGSVQLSSQNGIKTFVSKLDANGDFVWANKIIATAAGDPVFGKDIVLDASGSCYLSSYFNVGARVELPSGITDFVSNGDYDILITKLSPTGNFLWGKKIGGTEYDQLFSMKMNSSGNLFAVGVFSNSMTIDGFNTTSAGNSDIFFVKFNPSTCTATTATISASNCTSYTVPSGHETYTVSGTYTDTIPNAAGCDSVITINLTIGDQIAPVANLSALAAITAQCSVTSLTAPTATDNCAGTITGTHNASLPITTSGTTVVTWTYNDGNGNTSTQTQNVIINDNTAPVANVSSLPNVTGQCSVTSLTAPTATDNCAGTITGTHNASLPITTSGTTVVTWTYNDGHGNSSTQTQNVIISDNIAPVANVASLADITAQCSVTSLTAPTATDNCAGTITGTHNASLPIITSGTTVVTWTYNDGHGNSSTQTQNVIISDNIAPVANVASLADITAQCSVTSLTAPTATDNCAGTITGTHNASLPITTSGTTVVTWTYNDGHGNSSTQTQNVIISDNIAPVANVASLADITAQCSVTSLTAPTATDNCAGTITGTHNASLPITTSGTTVVTWTYNDGHGNTSTQMQNVIINDNTAPVAALANLPNVTGQCSVTSLTPPSATDNCAGTITGTHNVTLPISTPGTTVVTWTYDDGHGNTTTQTQNVIVTLPVATTTVSGITISATTSGATYQWINCGNGNTPVAGATSQSFTVTANGMYAVTVTQNGCSATSSCVTISTVGLNEFDQTTFAVYPNPNNGTFKVVIKIPATIRISNVAGQEVLSQRLEAGENILELPNAESGIYFISAENESGVLPVQRMNIIH